MPFKGIADLRSAEEPFELTEEQKIEWQKCAYDPIYFIKTYIKIESIDGIIPFNLHTYQEDLIRFFLDNQFAIGRIPRQMGKSFCAGIFMLWNAIFHNEMFNVIIAKKIQNSKEILDRIKSSFCELPNWLQPGLKTWKKDSIAFGNGSEIICSYGVSSTRGSHIDFLYVDEFAYFPYVYAEELIKGLFPTLLSRPNSRLVILSSTSGFNHFHKIWDDAICGKSLFAAIRLYWHQVPGRDEKWAKEMIRYIGQKRFDQQYNCDFLA